MFRKLSGVELLLKQNDFLESSKAPFSHTIIEGLLDPPFAALCANEFQQLHETKLDQFVHYSDPDFEFEKYAMNDVPHMPANLASLFHALHTPEFVAKIESLTGLKGLKADEERWGSGLHITKKGGYLACHKDFSVLPSSYKSDKQMLRTINIIGYLTPGWTPEWKGQLQLWNDDGSECKAMINPYFNNWAIFDTRNHYHCHPIPYEGERPRCSIAAYYYLEVPVERENWTSTNYLRLPWREETPEYLKKRIDRANAELRYKGMF